MLCYHFIFRNIFCKFKRWSGEVAKICKQRTWKTHGPRESCSKFPVVLHLCTNIKFNDTRIACLLKYYYYFRYCALSWCFSVARCKTEEVHIQLHMIERGGLDPGICRSSLTQSNGPSWAEIFYIWRRREIPFLRRCIWNTRRRTVSKIITMFVVTHHP